LNYHRILQNTVHAITPTAYAGSDLCQKKLLSLSMSDGKHVFGPLRTPSTYELHGVVKRRIHARPDDPQHLKWQETFTAISFN
jgi:hypothetical protein